MYYVKSKIMSSDVHGSKLNQEFKLKATIFLTGVTGISALIGFGTTVVAAKRKDPEYFNKGLIGSLKVHESGSSLALKALSLGTLYAFTGCGLLFYAIWKVSGASNLDEFRLKMGNILPKIPKKNPPVGRTEFEGLTDLLDYLQHQKSVKDE